MPIPRKTSTTNTRYRAARKGLVKPERRLKEILTLQRKDSIELQAKAHSDAKRIANFYEERCKKIAELLRKAKAHKNKKLITKLQEDYMWSEKRFEDASSVKDTLAERLREALKE